MPSYQQVYVGLTPEMIAALDDAGEAQDKSRAKLVREFVEQGLADVNV